MKHPLLIGIDIGTQGTKSALFGSDGKLVAESFEASRLISPEPGTVYQEADDLYYSVVRTIKKLLEKSGESPGNVAALSMDAQMAGIMGIDNNWNATTPYDSWLDTRCEKYISQMKEYEREIISLTGGQVTCAHGAKMLWWKNEQPDTYNKTAKFVMPSVYVAGRMCALSADDSFIDYTYLHFSGFADNLRKQWSDSLLQAFHISKAKLPKIVSPSETIGRISKAAAMECGLLEGTPVIAGCGDTAASSLGAGILKKGMVYDVAGTASVFACCTDKFTPDTENKTILFARGVIDGLFIPLAYISGGGMCLKWFSENHNIPLKELDKIAADIVAGSDGLYFVPHFSGRTCPADLNVKGAYLGLSWNHKPAHMYRSIMEAVAYEYHSYYSILKRCDNALSPTGIYGAGGGAKSGIFNQIKADVLGLPYYPLCQSDTATFASAMLAGYGAGVFDSLESAILQSAKTTEPFMPDRSSHEKYLPYALKYKEILDKIASVFQ